VRDRYEVTVLGINHRGDPTTVPYPVYTAAAGGDWVGVGRLLWMCDLVQPDVIVIQQDGWYFPLYVAELRKRKPTTREYNTPQHAAIPIVGAVAIDGKNFKGEWIKDLSLAVFWTQFAQKEAQLGGYLGRSEVIPLGVDLTMFYPTDRREARSRQKFGPMLDGKFIVGNVNRNQPRKRWDLTIKYFAEWVHSHKVSDAMLFLHSAPTGDCSVNVADLVRYYNVTDKVVAYFPEMFYGKSDEDMRDVYNCFDALITTTQGEGMGLPTMEAMACGVPCIVPEWSALGDWARGAAAMVPCTSTALQTFSPTVNVIGGIADERQFIAALDALYRDKSHRDMVGQLGLRRVSESRFRWGTIGERWIAALDAVLKPPVLKKLEIWQET
jgi:D-inositol-3-phosphate glycosyltransferase